MSMMDEKRFLNEAKVLTDPRGIVIFQKITSTQVEARFRGAISSNCRIIYHGLKLDRNSKFVFFSKFI